MSGQQQDLFAVEQSPAGTVIRPAVVPLDPRLAGPGQARRVDGDTSRFAASLIRAKAESERPRLLGAYADGLPWMDEEAAVRAGLDLHSEYATRVSELLRAGLLVQTAEMRVGAAGVPRRTCRISESGRLVLAKRLSYGMPS